MDPFEPEARLEARSAQPSAHRDAVQGMFDRLAGRYDRLNTVLSGGIDRVWRRRAMQHLGCELPPGLLLDLCAGTLDFSVLLARHFPTRPRFAMDLSHAMLVEGRRRARAPGVVLVQTDALALPLKQGVCAGITMGFGLRNVTQPEACLRELHRVLAPGGVLVILEFFRPEEPFSKLFHRVYGQWVIPAIGQWLSGERKAYEYLVASMEGFMTVTACVETLHRVGFASVRTESLFGGVATIVRAVR